jgi:hypothetical protein
MSHLDTLTKMWMEGMEEAFAPLTNEMRTMLGNAYRAGIAGGFLLVVEVTNIDDANQALEVMANLEREVAALVGVECANEGCENDGTVEVSGGNHVIAFLCEDCIAKAHGIGISKKGGH